MTALFFCTLIFVALVPKCEEHTSGLRSQILQQNTILRMKLTQDTAQFVTNEHIWQGVSAVSVFQSFLGKFPARTSGSGEGNAMRNCRSTPPEFCRCMVCQGQARHGLADFFGEISQILWGLEIFLFRRMHVVA